MLSQFSCIAQFKCVIREQLQIVNWLQNWLAHGVRSTASVFHDILCLFIINKNSLGNIDLWIIILCLIMKCNVIYFSCSNMNICISNNLINELQISFEWDYVNYKIIDLCSENSSWSRLSISWIVMFHFYRKFVHDWPVLMEVLKLIPYKRKHFTTIIDAGSSHEILTSSKFFKISSRIEIRLSASADTFTVL